MFPTRIDPPPRHRVMKAWIRTIARPTSRHPFRSLAHFIVCQYRYTCSTNPRQTPRFCPQVGKIVNVLLHVADMAADCVRSASWFTGRLLDRGYPREVRSPRTASPCLTRIMDCQGTRNHHFTPSLFPILLRAQVRYHSPSGHIWARGVKIGAIYHNTRGYSDGG